MPRVSSSSPRHLRTAGPPALLLVLALTAVACSSGDAGVAAFEEIQQGSVAFEFDPSGTTAVLRVGTSIDAACAVTFGETPELGSIATDRDMGGGAHDTHQPLLSGLRPDTEYHYRLQGVGEDGRLYRSELMTFRTPVAAADESPGTNVAVGASVVDVSSEFSASFAAGNAVDGDPGSEWSSRGDGDDAYLVIDLGRDVEVAAVGYQTRSMSDGTAITTTYTVTVDGGETFGPFPAGDGLLTVTDAAFTGRVIRFDVADSTGGNTGAVEVAVFEAP